jgi:hypothetical protein
VRARGVVGSALAASLFANAACGEREGKRAAPKPADSAAASRPARLEVRCFRLEHSVLLGPPTRTGQQGIGPGWIRFDGFGADSGTGMLVDANQAGLHTAWQRTKDDSVDLAGFDDFLRVEMTIAVSDTMLEGSAHTSSDAALERDSAGAMVEFNRRWTIRASRASCDSMPQKGIP